MRYDRSCYSFQVLGSSVGHSCFNDIALIQEFLDVLGEKVPAHGLLGQELGSLDVLDTEFSAAPAGEGLIHLPFT